MKRQLSQEGWVDYYAPLSYDTSTWPSVSSGALMKMEWSPGLVSFEKAVKRRAQDSVSLGSQAFGGG